MGMPVEVRMPVEVVHPANGAKKNDRAIAAKDHKLVDQLVNLWRSDAERNLDTRHRTGKLLNQRLGSPTERQPQGQRVLKTAAERLGIAESDLNRMRWYTHLVDVAGLRKQHPEIDTWTRFKEELTNLKAEYGFGARKPAANPSRPAFGGFARSLKNLTSKLSELDSQPDDAERARIVDALRALAEVASSRLTIIIEVAVGVKESNAVVITSEDRVA